MLFHSEHFRFALVLLIGCVLAASLAAQDPVVPLKNWPAPLYWQPSEQEASIIRHAHEMQPRAGASASQPVADPSAPLVFVAITPCRMMDTRGYDSTFVSGTVYGPPAMTAGGTRTVPVAGVTAGYCSMPATALAVSLNVTLWPSPGTQVQWLTLWPAGQPYPLVSTLNDYQGTMFNSANGIMHIWHQQRGDRAFGDGGSIQRLRDERHQPVHRHERILPGAERPGAGGRDGFGALADVLQRRQQRRVLAGGGHGEGNRVG